MTDSSVSTDRIQVIPIDEIIVDLDIYPRSGCSTQTVEEYADSIEGGQIFPPIVLEEGTMRLLDGMHRYHAYKRLDYQDVEVMLDRVPDGVPIKLYAASWSAKHGDKIANSDLKEVAREIIHATPEYNMQTVARMLGKARQTISNWVSDITERRRAVRAVKALLLKHLGWNNVEIADLLDVTEGQIRSDVKDDITTNLTEDLLREALEELPEDNGELAEVANHLREEQIFSKWSDEERELLDYLRAGETIVVNMHHDGHPNLVAWAEDTNRLVRIDRKTEWGNPFELGKDGTRDEVVDNYEHHYLPHKPSLLDKLPDLRGKALACWCFPSGCHGDVLKAWAES